MVQKIKNALWDAELGGGLDDREKMLGHGAELREGAGDFGIAVWRLHAANFPREDESGACGGLLQIVLEYVDMVIASAPNHFFSSSTRASNMSSYLARANSGRRSISFLTRCAVYVNVLVLDEEQSENGEHRERRPCNMYFG